MLNLKDRVRQQTNTTGTGPLTLTNAIQGYLTFSGALSNGDEVYYGFENGPVWEVGKGTYNTGVLTRDTVLVSNSGTGLTSASGESTVFITYPADKAVFLTSDGFVSGTGIAGIKFGDGTTQTTAASSPTGVGSGIAYFDPSSNALTGTTSFITNGAGNGGQIIFGVSASSPPYSGVSLYHDGSRSFIDSVQGGVAWHDFVIRSKKVIFSPQSDEVVSSGNIRIKSETPYLRVQDNSSSNITSLITDNAYGYLETESNNPLIIRTNGIERLRVGSSVSDPVLNFKSPSSFVGDFIQLDDQSDNLRARVDYAGSAFFNDITATGNFTVLGDFTYVNAETVTIEDKNIELASNSGSAISGDSWVDGGGITLRSTDSDKKITWVDSIDAWSLNQHLHISGSNYIIFGDSSIQSTAYTGVSGYPVGTANSVAFYNSAGALSPGTSNFAYDGTNLSIGTSSIGSGLVHASGTNAALPVMLLNMASGQATGILYIRDYLQNNLISITNTSNNTSLKIARSDYPLSTLELKSYDANSQSITAKNSAGSVAALYIDANKTSFSNNIRVGGNPNSSLIEYTSTGVLGHTNQSISLGIVSSSSANQGQNSVLVYGQTAFPTSTNIIGGGPVLLRGGDGASSSTGNAFGGDIYLWGGRGHGTGSSGNIILGYDYNDNIGIGRVGIGHTGVEALVHTSGNDNTIPVSIFQGPASHGRSYIETRNNAGTTGFVVTSANNEYGSYDAFGDAHLWEIDSRATTHTTAGISSLAMYNGGTIINGSSVGLMIGVSAPGYNHFTGNGKYSCARLLFSDNAIPTTSPGSYRVASNSSERNDTFHIGTEAVIGSTNERQDGIHMMLSTSNGKIYGSSTAANGGNLYVALGSGTGSGNDGHFEVRTLAGIKLATVDYNGNISGTDFTFGDGTTQTTASPLYAPYVSQTGNYTIPSTGYGVFISASGNSTITLPDHTAIGRQVNVVRIDSEVHNVTITGASSENIQLASSLSVATGESYELVSNGSEWRIK